MTLSDQPYLALDIGGTQIAAAAVDDGGRVIRSARVALPHSIAHTNPDLDAEQSAALAASATEVDPEQVWTALLGAIGRVCEELAAESSSAGGDPAACPFLGVGVGCAGPLIWPEGLVSPLAIPAWKNFPLRQRLRQLFAAKPDIPVRVHNSGLCLAIGEHWRGAGRGRDRILGIAISSGIGGGIINEHGPVNGRTGNAGHVGHMVVDPAGLPCRCGGRGCLETIAAAPPLLEWAQDQGWHPGETVTARDLVDDAFREHPVALAAIQRAGNALGIVIASLAAVFDLDTVIVGGGLSQAGPLLFEAMDGAVREHAQLPFTANLRVVPAALGQDATLVGAAALVISGGRYWRGD